MSDIVERLRGVYGPVCAAAADEIALLRSAVKHEADCVEAAKEEIERLRAEVEEHRSAQAKVYLALGVDEPDRDKWPAIITKLKDEKEMWKARAEFMGWGEMDAAWGDE